MMIKQSFSNDPSRHNNSNRRLESTGEGMYVLVSLGAIKL